MSIFATMLGLSAENYIKQGDEFMSTGSFGEAKIEFEKAEELISSTDTEKKEYIKNKIRECCDNLCNRHVEMSQKYTEAGEFEKAVELLELAFELSVQDSPRGKEIHTTLDRTKIKMYQAESDKQAEPLIERGDEFFKEGAFNEAMVEYHEAMKILKYFQDSEDELKRRAHEKLIECEVKIVEPYIERAKNFIETKMFAEALDELCEAREILEEDNKTKHTIDKLIADVHKQKGMGEEATEEDFISKQEWDEAMGDYKELLNLYFNYSYTDSDPFYPVHRNKYEDEFMLAKKKLGGLYVKRADGHFNQKKFAVALKYYVESEKFFDEEAPEVKYITDQIHACKNNIK